MCESVRPARWGASKAQPAREALRAPTNEPALRQEAEWALSRIAGVRSGEPPVASHVVPAPSVAPAFQTTVVQTGNPPVDWDITTGRNIVWSVELGNQTFGRPVVAGDAVYVGTDNARHLNPFDREEAGVLVALRAKDGKLLWQDVASRVERGLREFLLASTTSAPYVEGNRYYVTAECQLRCLDTEGFRDAVNNGPYRDEVFHDETAADIVWELDMCGRLGVFPHEASNSEVLGVGDLLMVSTSNGQNEGHTGVPSPCAPSLIAVEKRSGEVVWRAIGAGEDVLHGRWSSPVAATVNWRVQVLFGGEMAGCEPTMQRQAMSSGDLTAIRRTRAGFRGPECFRGPLSLLHRCSMMAAYLLRWGTVLGTSTDPH